MQHIGGKGGNNRGPIQHPTEEVPKRQNTFKEQIEQGKGRKEKARAAGGLWRTTLLGEKVDWTGLLAKISWAPSGNIGWIQVLMYNSRTGKRGLEELRK